MFRLCASLLIFGGLVLKLTAQSKNYEKPLTRILFIYDASNSMNGIWKTKAKHRIAQELLGDMLDSLQNISDLQVALRVFGHQKNYPPQDCDDTRLEVPFANNNFSRIKEKLDDIRARGTTPIAMSLEAAGRDFPPCDNCKNIIILITDGIEECDGDPCAVSYALQKQGIVVKPFVLGINIDDRFKKTYDCVGKFFDVSSEEEFRDVLGVVVSQALNNTSVQVNLLDVNGKPNETNVAMTLLNHFTGRVEYNLMHTLNGKGLPDTIPIDPALTYDLLVHTVPSVRKDSFDITPGIHNVVGVSAPQGDLNLPIFPNSLLNGREALVKKQGSCDIVNIQQFGQKHRYLVGNYDLEINTLPKTLLKDVRISQSHTTKIEIPEPGVAHINMDTEGYGSILVNKNGQWEWVYNMPSGVTKKSIYLQPGKYVLVFRTLKATETILTIEKEFTIKSGVSTTVNLF